MTKKAVIETLYKEGITNIRELMSKTGFPYGTVHNAVYCLNNPEFKKNHSPKRSYLSSARCNKRHTEATIGAKKRRQDWTERELNYLKEYGSIKTTRQLADDLDRSYHGVKRTANRYGISLRGNKPGANYIGVYSKERILDLELENKKWLDLENKGGFFI